MTFRTAVISNLEFLHQRLFGHPIGVEMRHFFKNLSWSFLGGGLASVVMLAVNIVAARSIGPQGFGQYNLVLTFSQLLMLPLVFSLDLAGVRSVAMSKTMEEQAQNISAALYFLAVNSCFITLLFLLTYRSIAGHFLIDVRLLVLVLIMALAMSFRNVSDGFIRALGLYQYQFFGRIAEVTVAVAIFLFLFFGFDQMNSVNYILALVGGSLVITLVFVVKLVPYLGHFNRQALVRQLSYGKVIFIAAILGTAFNSLDVVIIAHYLNVFQVGIYGAYYAASTNLVSQLVQMFINVFFPSISQSDNKEAIFHKINKLFWLFLPLCSLVLSILVWIIVSLFGSKYGIHLNYVIGFGVLATLQILSTVYASLITSISEKLFKTYMIFLNSLNLVHLVFYGLMIHFGFTSIQAIVIFLIINNIITITGQRIFISRNFAIRTAIDSFLNTLHTLKRK